MLSHCSRVRWLTDADEPWGKATKRLPLESFRCDDGAACGVSGSWSKSRSKSCAFPCATTLCPGGVSVTLLTLPASWLVAGGANSSGKLLWHSPKSHAVNKSVSQVADIIPTESMIWPLISTIFRPALCLSVLSKWQLVNWIRAWPSDPFPY